MEEERMETTPQEEPSYTPRPKWQIWMARIALVLFLLLLVMYYTNIFRGGR